MKALSAFIGRSGSDNHLPEEDTALRTIELRDGRWFAYSTGERNQCFPALPRQTSDEFLAEIEGLASSVSETIGTGVRVVDENGLEIEPWVVRQRREGAMELANHLLDKYQEA
ncbi:hypothetical protein [Sphingosinicella sp. BN140058]|uniref:hypothetical protein n=1 Tax=Sphingosinicella sp. BN140058 TaxID=1892855 RepID=UPI0010107B1A|nr:hypothetical protein [Sphingosinicella sp. BN140058]QAY80419.1 hypothetical protein ETR14_27655 [Sphingosinicella sp. BN140058]